MENHTFDRLDLQLLHALETDGRAPFSRIAEVLGVSDQTIARRFRRMRAEMNVRVVGVRDGERLGQDSWMLRLRCTPDTADQLAHALARRPDTAWVGITSGGTEVGCTTRSPHLDRLLNRLPRTVLETRAHQLLHRFYGGPEGLLRKSGVLTGEQVRKLRESAPTRPVPPAGPAALTPDDEPLVTALEQDGRATVAELQRATGRQESAVRRRLDQLLRSGALYIDMQFERDGFEYSSRAVLWITAAPSALATVGQALAAHPEVAFASATSGGSNLVAVVVCRDTASVYRYLSEGVGGLEGVQHVECAPVLRTVKQLTYAERRRAGARA
ncbi:Lrp/AsnC family transcriptional regulator [Streptomyces sp. NPDC088725]|uniref:Lrp/AsnC family transcriptional regulator n=1 Tax=Streptomyces sp. NPDC088725 TaxID=3365873 RepID=UPI0037F62D41